MSSDSAQPLWDLCYNTSGKNAIEFIERYFGSEEKVVHLISGGGFDSRSCYIPIRLAGALASGLTATFIREERPNPDPTLLERADANVAALTTLIPNHTVRRVWIFADDGNVIGGREAVSVVHGMEFSGLTDIVIDVSALSTGVSFPIIRYLWDLYGRTQPPWKLHLFVADSPETDDGIRAVSAGEPAPIHGFAGRHGLASDDPAKLWIPQLKNGQQEMLEKIFRSIAPHDTCPIVPFPATDARRGDELLEAFGLQLSPLQWSVDPRNVIYAREDDPLDLYRTLVRIWWERKQVFQDVGGSEIILSPVGSKVVGIGALLAALDKDLPITYMEAASYKLIEEVVVAESEYRIVHIWLAGGGFWDAK